MISRKILIVALVFPWVILGGLLAYKMIDRAQGQVWQLPVEGYDPRNLIYGHFARVRINWPNVQIRPGLYTEENRCLCLEAENPKANPLLIKSATFQACEAVMAQCTGIIRMTSDDVSRAYEIYIAEEDGPRIDELLRRDDYRGRITVQSYISDEGTLQFNDLYVDHSPLKDFLKTYQHD